MSYPQWQNLQREGRYKVNFTYDPQLKNWNLSLQETIKNNNSVLDRLNKGLIG